MNEKRCRETGKFQNPSHSSVVRQILFFLISATTNFTGFLACGKVIGTLRVQRIVGYESNAAWITSLPRQLEMFMCSVIGLRQKKYPLKPPCTTPSAVVSANRFTLFLAPTDVSRAFEFHILNCS